MIRHLAKYRARAGVLLGLSLVTIAAFAGQAVVEPGAPGRLRLVYGGDADFDATLARFFPDIAHSPEFAAIQSTSLIVVNSAPAPIRMAVIQWKIDDASGNTQTQYQLIGSAVDDSPMIASGSAVLVSPLSYAESGSQRNEEFLRSYAQSESLNRLMAAKNITGILDGVLFANDVLVGRDTYDLAHQYTCQRRSAIAIAAEVRPELGNQSGVVQKLRIEANYAGGAKDDPCAGGVSKAAMRLLNLEKTSGASALDEAVKRMAALSEPAVHRLPYYRRFTAEAPSDARLDALGDRLHADRHGMIVAKLSDTDLAQVLDASYPRLRNDPHLEPFVPLMVYVRNESQLNVLAYTIAFTVVPLHGQTEVMHVTLQHKADLPGRISDVTPVLERHESRVVGPWFNWGTVKWKDNPDTSTFAGLARFRFVSAVPNARNVEVSLDAVVFDDGSIVGPDVYDLRDQFESLRNGERAEGVHVAQMLAQGQTANGVADYLKAQISLGRDAIGKTDKESLERTARAARAGDFERILRERGPEALKLAANRLASYGITALRVVPDEQTAQKSNSE